MDHDDDLKKLEPLIESALFAIGGKVSHEVFAKILNCDKNDVKRRISPLIYQYNNTNRGLMIVELDGGYQLASRPEYHEDLKNILDPEKKIPLSQAQLETLAIIAYNAPVTKAKVESIRGVNSDSSFSKLLSRKLIQESGRLDAPGKPYLFEVTDEFLRTFGIKSKGDLPMLPMAETEELN